MTARALRRDFVASALIVACVSCVRHTQASPVAAGSVPSDSAAWVASAAGRVATDSEYASHGMARPEELFMGRFTGVQVFRTPEGLSLRIRGSSSFYGNTEPLIVLDGLPLQQRAGVLDGLNPSDIQKIEVLKDPTMLAQYGSRGANGVVLITTKRP